MSHTGSVWHDGLEPGPQVVALGAASALSVVALNLMLVGELSYFFDLCFVVVCFGLALVVRPRGFFTVGVLPPLMMLALFVLLAFIEPGTIARADDAVVQAVVSGLAHHSGALVAGYLLCLVTLALRHRALTRDGSGERTRVTGPDAEHLGSGV